MKQKTEYDPFEDEIFGLVFQAKNALDDAAMINEEAKQFPESVQKELIALESKTAALVEMIGSMLESGETLSTKDIPATLHKVIAKKPAVGTVRSARVKITPVMVQDITTALKAGKTIQEIAEEYGISISSVACIKKKAS